MIISFNYKCITPVIESGKSWKQSINKASRFLINLLLLYLTGVTGGKSGDTSGNLGTLPILNKDRYQAFMLQNKKSLHQRKH